MNLRGFANALMGIVLDAVARRLPPPRVIMDRHLKSPYLSRWHLTHKPYREDGAAPFDTNGNPTPKTIFPATPFALLLHRFHQSDDGPELHNHPWEWALSFVLAGGYSEERRMGARVVRRAVLPFTFNFIDAEDYHRVDLLEREAWTLFLTGRKMRSWSFWNPHTDERTPWRKHLEKARVENGTGR